MNTQLIKNKDSLSTKEVLAKFNNNESTKEIVSKLSSDSNEVVEERNWHKPQFQDEEPTLERLLDYSGYGNVYLGKWKTQIVAIKETFNLVNKDKFREDIKAFERFKK